MEREKIIKALTCCYIVGYCFTCPYYEIGEHPKVCRRKMAKDAIALLKELTEENERLKQLNESYAEIEQGCIVTGVKKVQADTVREMQERFKELMGVENASCGFCNAVGYWSVKAVKDNIDRIANEILNNTEDEEK